MTISAVAKRERLEVRLTLAQKERMQRAAAIEGATLTDFVIRSAQRAAEQIIRDHDVMVLTMRDSQTFVEALLSPPAPNSALRAAAQHYSRVMGGQ